MSPKAKNIKGVFPGEVIRSARKFGVEIELTHLKKTEFQEDMARYGIRYQAMEYHRGSTREVMPWVLKGDGSVRGMALELISPPLSGPKGCAEMKLVMELVRINEGKVDDSCGFHVHHNASDLNDTHLKNLLVIWYKYQDMMYQLCDKKREHSRYCKKLKPNEFKKLYEEQRTFGANIRMQDRYSGLNFEALTRHGTVEFRLLEGHINPEKAEAWVALTQRLVLLARHTEHPIKPNKVGDQVQLLGAITKMLSRNGYKASEREEQAFMLLSRIYHANKRKLQVAA